MALTLLVVCGCRQSGTTTVITPTMTADPVCGDGELDAAEECDGSDFGGATCKLRGFDRGQLACDAKCHFVETLCERQCGNGRVDVGETCDGDAGVSACPSFGSHGCSASCQLETSHCVTTAFADGQAFFMTNGGPAVIADLPPSGARDLVVAVPSFGRVETFPWVVQQGFSQTQSRKLSFETTPRVPSVADFNGDGLNDVITLNDDGAIDVLLAKTTGFLKVPATDVRCAGGHFIAPTVLSCGPTVLVLQDGGVTRVSAAVTAFTGDLWSASANLLRQLAAPDFVDGGVFTLVGAPTAIALGDLDGDGDLDLANFSAGTLTVLERTATAFAVKVTFSDAAANHLAISDVDLDGRPDLVWLSGTDVIIRRNNGGFAFTEFRVPIGATAPLSFNIADVDGDSDLDLVITSAQGGEATRTDVKLNRVR